MKLKLVVRFNQFVIHTLELEPGNYDIGRGSENDININHPSIRRKHGKLSYAGGAWTYQEFAAHNLQQLNDRQAIELSSEIDIATEDYTLIETTNINRRNPLISKERRRDKIMYGFLIGMGLVLGTIGTYLIMHSQSRVDPNALLSQVRSKIVVFELASDPQANEDYKTMGGLANDDFRPTFGYCTGFLVAPNVVLTASHCLWGGDFLDLKTDFSIRTADDKLFKPTQVLGFDPIRDFLFLEVPGMEAYGHLEFASDYKIGQTVYTMGNAHGQGIAIREGIMASETVDENNPSVRFIRYSAGASPGNSGGPLIDQNGRIVALVFAATGAENYNLGTSAKDLAVGFKKFVTDRSPKEIKFTLKKLFNFNMTQFLAKQVLPFLPEYNEFPETVQKIGNVEFTFKVPVSFDKVAKDILDEIQTHSAKAVEDLTNTLLSKGEVVLDWSSFASDLTPAIHPSQFDVSQNSFYLFKGRYYMENAGFLDSPNRKDFKNYVEQFRKEKKFDFQAYGMNSELVPPGADGSILYMPRDKSKSKQTIEDLAQGTLYSQMTLKQKIDDPEIVKKFLDHYLGTDGVLSAVYSPFVRPEAYKNFTISKIDKKSEMQDVRDGRGRQWKRFYMKLFEQYHLYIYCLPLPEAVSCASRMIIVDEPYRLELLESNFRKYILAHFLENPYFWEPNSLIDFMAKPAVQGLTSFQGVTLKKNPSGDFSLNLHSFKLELQLPAQMQSLRIQTGLFKGKNRKPEWTGYGAEWVETAGSPRVCGVGVEPVGSHSNYILNVMRDALKRAKFNEDDKQKSIPKLWTQNVSSPQGDELQIYGYCAPLRENPNELGYYLASFNKALPRQGTYKLLK